MGREAKCPCRWGAEEAECKVLLEGPELIFRQGMRRRVPLSSLKDVAAIGENLVFRAGRDRVEVGLGREAAERWLKAIVTPPPGLAAKLGITSTTKLRVLGDLQSEELKAAVAQAGSVGSQGADLVLLCADTESTMLQAFDRYLSNGDSAPLWIVYPKGPASLLKASAVRSLLRGHGFIDTKVASVSAKLTALRFVKR